MNIQWWRATPPADGPGDHPLVLVIGDLIAVAQGHGTEGTGASWERVRRRFEEAGYTWACENEGHTVVREVLPAIDVTVGLGTDVGGAPAAYVRVVVHDTTVVSPQWREIRADIRRRVRGALELSGRWVYVSFVTESEIEEEKTERAR